MPTFTKPDKGIRLNVPEQYSGKMMVVQTSRPYGLPMLCQVCKEVHKFKHYHLRIGADGSVIVSRKIYYEMVKADQIDNGNGIIVSNGVVDPPAQIYGQRTHVRTERMPKIKVKKVI